MLGEIFILLSVLLPLSVAVTLIKKSSALSSAMGSGCPGRAWSKHNRLRGSCEHIWMAMSPVGVSHRGALLQVKAARREAIRAVACEILPQMPWELMSLKYNCAHGPMSSCVAVCLQTVSKWH